MAINFGAFAGGLSKGFSDTYRMLSEEEERELAMKERRDRMTREAQARTAALETIGRSGQDTYTPELQARGADAGVAKILDQQNAGFGPEGYAEASRATAGALSREAVPTQMQTRAYKESEAVGDYARRLAAIDPDKALATSTQARQLKQLERSEDLQAKFDAASEKLNKDLALIAGTAESGGMKGMAELAKKNGLNVQFVEGANGTGRINLLGKDGKPVQTFADVASAADALSQARLGRFIEESIPTLGSADKVIAALGTQQQMKLAQRADDRAEKKLPGEMEYTAAQTKKALAETAGAELKGREAKEYADLRSKMLKILENPTAENQAELRQLARRAAILNPKEVLVTKAYTDPETGIAKTITTNVLTGEVQESLREAGVPNISKPQLDKVRGLAAQGLNGNGKPATAQDIADYEKVIGEKWPGPSKSKPTAAIPATAPRAVMPPQSAADQTAGLRVAQRASTSALSQQELEQRLRGGSGAGPFPGLR